MLKKEKVERGTGPRSMKGVAGLYEQRYRKGTIYNYRTDH